MSAREGDTSDIVVSSLTQLRELFSSGLEELAVRRETRSYVVGVLTSARDSKFDMSRESLVLRYEAARQRGQFETLQHIGDWVLFVGSFAPEHLAERELCLTLGRMSYASCWRILRGEWTLYEELADRLPEICDGVRRSVFAHVTNAGPQKPEVTGAR